MDGGRLVFGFVFVAFGVAMIVLRNDVADGMGKITNPTMRLALTYILAAAIVVTGICMAATA